MAKAAEDAEFNKENKKNIGVVHDEFGFPSEFPYEFDSFGAETESSDEEDFFAGLTRRLSHASLHETRNPQLTVPISKPEVTFKYKIQKLICCFCFHFCFNFFGCFGRVRRRFGA